VTLLDESGASSDGSGPGDVLRWWWLVHGGDTGLIVLLSKDGTDVRVVARHGIDEATLRAFISAGLPAKVDDSREIVIGEEDQEAAQAERP
jgi:hypothetical protein